MHTAGHSENHAKTFSQHRSWLKTSFTFARKHLDYSIDSKRETSLRQKIAWDSVAPPSSYFSTIEPDKATRWMAFVITGVALVASLRGGPQPLTFLLYAGAAIVLLAAVNVTSRLRRVAYTAIPAKGVNVVILQDKQHDEIVHSIESARAKALAKFTEPGPGMSVRDHLRRLRWLVDAGVLTSEDFAQRQKLVLPSETRPMLAPAAAAGGEQSFHQRRLGVAIDVTLLQDRMSYRRSSWFGGTESYSVPYRNLSAPSSFFQTGHQLELTLLALAWVGIAVLSWANYTTQVHAPGYYVGGEGLRRALGDFGPALLALIAASAIIPLVTRLRYARPYASIELLHDKRYDAILKAIEERRLAAQRQLAEPDPLLTAEEQMNVLNDLRDEDIISDEEHGRAARRAAFICDHPLLDRPVLEEHRPAREYALH